MSKDFTIMDWVDAIDSSTDYVVPEDVKNQIKEAGTAFHKLCVEYDVPCVLAFASKMNASTVGIEHIYHLAPLNRVPMELLVMSMLSKAGTKDACELGLDLIKYLEGEPINDQ